MKKDFEIEYSDKKEIVNQELLQFETTKNHYFKIIVSKNDEYQYGTVTGINIYEKRTDRLLQTFDLECEFSSYGNVSVDDYNFDAIEDFSVYEAGYAGPNTSSIYFLKHPNKNSYFESEISGISLSFDSKTKTINEHNQCCAGTSHISTTYKLVNNKMILLKQVCEQYDEETEQLEIVPCD